LPLRGAISYGKLCTNKELDIIIGEALVDAYNYCESQNWIGQIYTPSAITKLMSYGYSMDTLTIKEVCVPFLKKNFSPKAKRTYLKRTKELLWAYAINENSPFNGRKLIDIIKDMKDKAPDQDKEKYDNTLEFITGTQYKLASP